MLVFLILIALGVIFLTLVAAVEFENRFTGEPEPEWDNEGWEAQRG